MYTRPIENQLARGEVRKETRCYSCEGRGHLSRDCPNNRRTEDLYNSRLRKNEVTRLGMDERKEDERKKEFTCYNCGEKGHVATRCDKQKGRLTFRTNEEEEEFQKWKKEKDEEKERKKKEEKRREKEEKERKKKREREEEEERRRIERQEDMAILLSIVQKTMENNKQTEITQTQQLLSQTTEKKRSNEEEDQRMSPPKTRSRSGSQKQLYKGKMKSKLQRLREKTDHEEYEIEDIQEAIDDLFCLENIKKEDYLDMLVECTEELTGIKTNKKKKQEDEMKNLTLLLDYVRQNT